MRIYPNTECLRNDMSVTVQQSGWLLEGGPPHWLQRSLGLIKPGYPMIARRAKLVVLVGWVPLVVLAVVQSIILRNQMAKSFFSDFAVYARSLIAAPLLILAEADCIPRLDRVARHFLVAGLITEPDRARFDDAVSSTKRLLGSGLAELIVALLAYGLVITLMINVPPDELPAWYWLKSGYSERLWDERLSVRIEEPGIVDRGDAIAVRAGRADGHAAQCDHKRVCEDAIALMEL